MTRLTKPQYRIATIASALGIIQGIAWFVMSLICIILYLGSQSSSFPLPPQSSSYQDYLNYAWYINFLYGNYPSSTNIINPDSFHVFMWIYLMGDILWVALSLIQLRAINRIANSYVSAMKLWGVLTVLISAVDLLLVILIGAEYAQYCLPDAPNPGQEESCSLTYLPVLVIAARGFVLWFVNLAFAFAIYRIIKTILAGKNLDKKLLYADTTIPRATLQSPSNNVSQQQPPPQPPRPVDNRQSNNFWNNNPRPVSYDGRVPPTNNPYAYPTQQRNYPAY